MKVYACPKEIVLEATDYRNFDPAKEASKEEAHKAALKAWLVARGYNASHTGKVVRFQVADGFAQYMLADGGKKCALVHLPYGDAYQYRDAQFLPKAEVLNRIKQDEAFAALFAKAS